MNNNIDEERDAQNNDRELIADFLEYTKEVQKGLGDMESNNTDMQDLV